MRRLTPPPCPHCGEFPNTRSSKMRALIRTHAARIDAIRQGQLVFDFGADEITWKLTEHGGKERVGQH